MSILILFKKKLSHNIGSHLSDFGSLILVEKILKMPGQNATSVLALMSTLCAPADRGRRLA